MQHTYKAPFIAAVILAAVTGVSAVHQTSSPSPDLSSMIARFAPVEITADTSRLPANERQALEKLIEAARLMDSLFLRQVWAGNDALLQRLAREAVREADATGSAADERLQYFLINKGPWSRLDDNEPFIQGVPPKPESANY